MSQPLKILFIAAEASPFAKVGGLGDVIGSLPKELRRVGHDARIVLPHYGTINGHYEIVWQDSFTIPFLGNQETIRILELRQKTEVPLYLIGNARYFDRMAVYGEDDDGERFQLFARAAMEIPKRLNWQPDIIHCHDWHTALCCGLLKKDHQQDEFYSSTASVFTIHNLAYQGWIDDAYIWKTNLHRFLLPAGNPFRGKTYSMMGIGIAYSDIITTVSETYAREILTPEFGCGMEDLLQTRKNSLFGILNGLDYEEFNPATDKQIPRKYSIKNLESKFGNKLALQKLVGLPVNQDIPLIGMAGRLVDQKGPDIAAEALESLLPDANVQLILQGTGETHYKEILEKLEKYNIRKARLFFVLDFALVNLIYAGSDIFLMPSRFEPCGLAPMIAMRYGTIPVVRHTGGMVETVPAYSADMSTGLGFVFEKYDAAELLVALRSALSAYQNVEKWRDLVIRAMSADYSWRTAIPKYEAVYTLAKQRSAIREF
jgi:starch synthase